MKIKVREEIGNLFRQPDSRLVIIAVITAVIRGESVDELTEWTNKESDEFLNYVYNYLLQKREEYKDKIKVQNQTAEIIASLSPSFLLKYTAMTLAGTGPYSAEKFLKAIETYNPNFFNYVLSHFEPESYRYKYPSNINLTDAPKFDFKTADLYPPTPEVAKHIMTLFSLCMPMLIPLALLIFRE